MGNNFSSKYELFRNVKADDKKGLNRNYGIFLVLRRKTGPMAGSGSPQVMRIAAGMADKPAPKASLREKLDLFKTQAAGTQKQAEIKEKRKEVDI